MAVQLELDFARPAKTKPRSDARNFLGWDRPALALVAERLLSLAPPHDRVIDLQGVVVAVASARAGRRLLSLLVEASERAHRGLLPPRIVTLGALPETLYEPEKPLASPEEVLLAWLHALERSPEECALLHLEPGLASARVGEGLAAALAAERKGLSAAIAACLELDAARMAARFSAWQAIHARMLARLDALGLQDRLQAREQALARGVSSPKTIVLACVPEMAGLTAAMLARLEVHAYVYAPAALAERFDGLGRVLEAKWIDAPVAFRDEAITFLETAREQADAARDFIASLGELVALDEVAIGVLDEEISAPVAEALGAEGVLTHTAEPRPFVESPLARLLSATAAVLDDRSMDAVAAWMRHPDIQHALALRERDLSLVDRYRLEHLPQRFAPPFLRAASTADLLGKGREDERDAPALQSLHERMEALLAPLTRAEASDLGQWSAAMVEFLARVYAGRELVREHPDDEALLDALDVMLSFAERMQRTATPSAGGARAIAMALELLSEETVAVRVREPAIELLGWLELLSDDAPCLLLLGLNDGSVPEARNADAFLPNGLRRKLGLPSNETRHARDVYVASALLASREKLFVTLGRRSLVGDPRLPSRLLFHCDPAARAARLARFVNDVARAPAIGTGTSEALRPPRPAPLDPPITKLRVTAFGDYLKCPYRFYLQHVLHLDESRDLGSGEIDARTWGTMGHALLHAFALSEVKDSTDARSIGDWLEASLGRAMQLAYGEPLPPLVLLQREQMRARLFAFAKWQAAWRAQGFAICEAELALDDVSFPVDGRPFLLSGRIDRVDRHDDGRVCVLDYKTQDRAKDPDKAHRDGERWIDLQLPLYRYMLLQRGERAAGMTLGYVPISAEAADVSARLVVWGNEVWQSAEQCAADVVRKLRGADPFWPPTRPAPRGFDRFSIICQDEQLSDLEEPE